MSCCGKVKAAFKVGATATGAMVRYSAAVMGGKATHVSAEVFAARMEVCRACPHVSRKPHSKTGQTLHRCGLCQCWLDGPKLHKAKLATEACPADRWGETSNNG